MAFAVRRQNKRCTFGLVQVWSARSSAYRINCLFRQLIHLLVDYRDALVRYARDDVVDGGRGPQLGRMDVRCGERRLKSLLPVFILLTAFYQEHSSNDVVATDGRLTKEA